ncbi:hypothetical protein EJ05DRAFT_172048 [Pseudovirgaria hyperparasitica]|uniref:NAD(P)-binding protein n=1 Tax=Pseudovirgaria hyperparasitica TaxID=470096 RepID=A0A6A6VVY5_9PEZI|nr:uncharacterized protein EJ05DRAFT_172048 [Pseudovirgaria hyperparasitica]KAF2753800.1 hypothetical protein EJ05DRAFT_172048 [Pseudovirgaria hyperparasitica]
MRSCQRVLVVGAASFSGLRILEHFLDAGLPVRAMVSSPEEVEIVENAFPASQYRLLDSDIRIGMDRMALEAALTRTITPFDTVVYALSPTSTLNTADTYRSLINAATASIAALLLTVKVAAPRVTNVIISTTTSLVGSWILHNELPSQAIFEKHRDGGDPTHLGEVCSDDYISACNAGLELIEEDLRAFMVRQKPHFSLTTLIAPSIYGPHLQTIGRGSLGDDWHGASNSCDELAESSAQYLDVRDFASAHVKAAVIPSARGGTFTLCTGQVISCRQSMGEAIADILKRTRRCNDRTFSRSHSLAHSNEIVTSTLAFRPRYRSQPNDPVPEPPKSSHKHQFQPKHDASSLGYACPTNAPTPDSGRDHKNHQHTAAFTSSSPLESHSDPESTSLPSPQFRRHRTRDSGIDLAPIWIPNADVSPMTLPIGVSHTKCSIDSPATACPWPDADRIRQLSYQDTERMQVSDVDMSDACRPAPLLRAYMPADRAASPTERGFRGNAESASSGSDAAAIAATTHVDFDVAKMKELVAERAADLLGEPDDVEMWDSSTAADVLGMDEYRSVEETLLHVAMQMM